MIKSEDEIPFVFGPAKLAEILGVSRTTAYVFLHSEGFPLVRNADGAIVKPYRIYKKPFLQWLEGEQQPNAM